MPEEFEEAAEVALEAAEEGARGSEPAWVQWASVSTMLMALVSAIGGLQAGKAANEAIIERQEEIVERIEVNRAQLEREMLLTRAAVAESLGKPLEPPLRRRIEADAAAIGQHRAEATADRTESTATLDNHELLAVGTTVLSIAITLTAMAVIVRRKAGWYGGLAIAAAGAAIVAYGSVTL